MAALTAESVAEIVCESGEDSSAYENDTEDEALVNGEPDEDGTERERVDRALDEECIDGKECEGDRQAKVSGETSTECEGDRQTEIRGTGCEGDRQAEVSGETSTTAKESEEDSNKV